MFESKINQPEKAFARNHSLKVQGLINSKEFAGDYV